MFIDELPKNDDEISIMTKFLRNICRAIRIPSNISGTNSRIRNLVAIVDASVSRNAGIESYPWVQVTVKTPQSSLQTFCHLIKFKPHDSDIASSCLKDYVHLESNTVLFDQLFNKLYGSFSSQYIPVQKLIEFLIKQSETCLPGITLLIFTRLFEILPNFTDSKTLWVNLQMTVITDIMRRKKSMKSSNGLLDSAHILTFPSLQKQSLENGRFSSNLVENHLFRYGKKGDETFRLDLKLDEVDFENDEPCFVRNEVDYDDKCYFPEIDQDFFTTFISLGVWNAHVVEFERLHQTRRSTLGTIYEYYLVNIKKHSVNAEAVVTDSFALELLAHWSICHASHLNFNGEADGVEIFSEFVKNIQNLENKLHKKLFAVTLNGLDNLHMSLSMILNRVKVPYLVRLPSDKVERATVSNELEEYLGDFVHIGRSFLPKTNIGWDVVFDMSFDDCPCTGYIECKLWAESIGYAGFFKYYEKACKGSIPLSFMVCRSLQNAVSSENASEILVQNLLKAERGSVEEIPEYISEHENEEGFDSANEEEDKPKKPKKPKKDYFALLNDLWSDSKNHINIYTVKYNNFPSTRSGNFTVKELIGFDNPKGAFILVESSFNPPSRSSYS